MFKIENQEQNRELTKWADVKEYFTDNDGCQQRKIIQFNKSLDPCFKYLVPKAIKILNTDFNWDEKGCLGRIFKDWQRTYLKSKGVLSYAQALCKVIEKLMDTEVT